MVGKRKKIIIVGAGGHARVVASILNYHYEFEVIGIADRNEDNVGEVISGYKIITTWDKLPEMRNQRIDYIALAIGDNHEREKMFHDMKSAGFSVVTLIHPEAFLEKDCVLGQGTLVCAGAIIATNVDVGENSIINTGTIIDHEGSLGNHVHIAPGVVISGRVEIGDYSFVGTGVRIIDKIKVGRNVLIGAGSVVIEDIPDNVTAVGVPARLI